MRGRNFFSLLATTLVIASSGQAGAKRELFNTVWLVEPTQSLPTEVSVSSGETIFRQRLLPMGIAQLEEDFVSRQVSLPSIPKGTVLVLATGASRPVWCAVSGLRTEMLSALLSPVKTKLTSCFIDDDDDGYLDRAFMGSTDTEKLPQPQGALPNETRRTITIRYSIKQDSASYSPFSVGILYERRGLHRFHIVYGVEQKWGFLTSHSMLSTKELLPKQLSVLGSDFTVLGQEKKMVRVRVNRGIPAQPFGVSVTVERF